MEMLSKLFGPLLHFAWVRRVRRNHALEHATIHVLARYKGRLAVAGRSSLGGFALYGDVETALVEKAAAEALDRLRRGEASLAVHPNCGTNLLVTGSMASMAGIAAMLGSERAGWRQRLERLPMAMMLGVFAVFFSRPIGIGLQRFFTTDGDVGGLHIVEIEQRRRGPILAHFVHTRGG
jgi:hypothetical protein